MGIRRWLSVDEVFCGAVLVWDDAAMARTYIVFLRGINVGGTGKLPMADLRALCEHAGLANVRAYIQSGNVTCESSLGEAALLKTFYVALAARMGKRVALAVWTVDELVAVVSDNPFPEAEPAKVGKSSSLVCQRQLAKLELNT